MRALCLCPTGKPYRYRNYLHVLYALCLDEPPMRCPQSDSLCPEGHTPGHKCPILVTARRHQQGGISPGSLEGLRVACVSAAFPRAILSYRFHAPSRSLLHGLMSATTLVSTIGLYRIRSSRFQHRINARSLQHREKPDVLYLAQWRRIAMLSLSS
jgi:hypothetical protein